MTTALKEMKPIYKMFVLDSEEYDSLHKYYPMRKEDLESSLGFAYGKTKEAFIRRTGNPEWDEETILHEAEELLAKNSSHEDEQNIRWKKGKDIFSKIIPLVVGGIVTALTGGGAAPLVGGTMASILGGAASAGTSAIAQKNMSSAGTINPLEVALSGVGSGLAGKGIVSGVNASKAAGGGLLGQTLSGIQGGVGITPGAAKATSVGGVSTTAPKLVEPLGTQFAAQQAAQFGSPISSANGLMSGMVSGGVGGLSVAPLLKAATPSLLGTSSLTPVGGNSIGTIPTPANLSAPGFSGSTTPNLPSNPLQNAFAQNNQNLLGGNSVINAPSAPAPTMPNLAATNTVEAAPKSSLLSTLGKKAGEFITNPMNILGGASLLASQAPKQPEFEMPPSVEAIRSQLLAPGMTGGALTDVGKKARLELGNIMSAKPTELYPTANDEYYNAALRRTRESYGQAEKQLDAAYNLAGTYGSGEHMAEKAKLKEQLARTESALASETEQRRFELARTAQYQAIQDSLNVDKATMDDLVGLTGLDVQTAAMVYGADVKDVQEIRNSLGTVGMELLVRGNTPTQGQGGININLGGTSK